MERSALLRAFEFAFRLVELASEMAKNVIKQMVLRVVVFCVSWLVQFCFFRVVICVAKKKGGAAATKLARFPMPASAGGPCACFFRDGNRHRGVQNKCYISP